MLLLRGPQPVTHQTDQAEDHQQQHRRVVQLSSDRPSSPIETAIMPNASRP